MYYFQHILGICDLLICERMVNIKKYFHNLFNNEVYMWKYGASELVYFQNLLTYKILKKESGTMGPMEPL
jgi:hypothetical protein